MEPPPGFGASVPLHTGPFLLHDGAMPELPTPAYVERRCAEFDAEPRYRDADRAIELAVNQWPRNTDIGAVLAKATLLNSLYSTRILGIHQMARHIAGLEIDERLDRGDRDLVEAIARATIQGKPRYNLSFASKYCAWHRPEHFQIFDSYVEELLWAYRREHGFAAFLRKELRSYPAFVRVVDTLVDHCGLRGLSRKQLD